ncbi:MAG TPA: GNAT family N-acetyltransferase [Acidimicrobiia bacterium]|nr:GNAT family N-acetyltransferase [Acidimicrobiia bacterium]
MNGQAQCAGLVIRPLQPDDGERLGRLFGRLSPETVYRRFFTRFPGLPAAILRYFATGDHDDHQRLAAVCGDEIVAVASWDKAAHGGDAAEIAILVEDAWQHCGVGRGLMRTLTAGAADHGITTLTATVLTENGPARRLAKSLARPQLVELDGPETHFTYRVAS